MDKCEHLCLLGVGLHALPGAPTLPLTSLVSAGLAWPCLVQAGESALYVACRVGSPAVVQALLMAGVAVDKATPVRPCKCMKQTQVSMAAARACECSHHYCHEHGVIRGLE